ncbi:Hypothetical_protein [Hexamita inflata]|uniref:Hypothetical_protein n=1 Tax=Hexamita inflata TaxID=28002 RepID=A0AA86P3N9_9EUKA|nr:Hypothetical protein HINF_LOCUS17920 [Hexamita inflata]
MERLPLSNPEGSLMACPQPYRSLMMPAQHFEPGDFTFRNRFGRAASQEVICGEEREAQPYESIDDHTKQSWYSSNATSALTLDAELNGSTNIYTYSRQHNQLDCKIYRQQFVFIITKFCVECTVIQRKSVIERHMRHYQKDEHHKLKLKIFQYVLTDVFFGSLVCSKLKKLDNQIPLLKPTTSKNRNSRLVLAITVADFGENLFKNDFILYYHRGLIQICINQCISSQINNQCSSIACQMIY